MLNSDGKRDSGRLLINLGLTAVIILIVVTLVTSIYEIVRSDGANNGGFWRDPQIIAVAIGLILSVLFVDRWRSLEEKVDNLSRDQADKLKDIQSFSKEHIELQVGQIVDKAEKVSSKVSSLVERHPWLEVISERDIIVETESVRGILRTSYGLLKDKKYLHLFEYLEYNSRKGTSGDNRDSKLSLRGTADDFIEIASFCEVWLGDFALSAEFLKRYIEQAGNAGYIMYPDYIRRLMKIGNLPLTKDYIHLLSAIVSRDRLHAMIPFFRNHQPMSERYRWYASNVLALAHSLTGDLRKAERNITAAHRSTYAHLFHTEQTLFDVEVMIGRGNFGEAVNKLDEVDELPSSIFELRDRILLLERLGAFDRAAKLRRQIEKTREKAFGDDWHASDVRVEPADEETVRRSSPKPEMNLREEWESASKPERSADREQASAEPSDGVAQDATKDAGRQV